MKLFLIIETGMTGIWGFLMLFCFCLFSENLHTHTRKEIFSSLQQSVRRWDNEKHVRWMNTATYLLGCEFCPTAPHSGHPQFPKTSVSKGDADAGQRMAAPAPLLASVQLPAYPLRDTCTPPPPPLPSSLEIFPYQYTELFTLFSLNICIVFHCVDIPLFFFSKKQIPFVSKNSATILS